MPKYFLTVIFFNLLDTFLTDFFGPKKISGQNLTDFLQGCSPGVGGWGGGVGGGVGGGGF